MSTEYCAECECEPCVWKENKQIVLHGINDWLTMNNLRDEIANNTKRKKCYHTFGNIINGPMGRGNRAPLPDCVIQGVRESFPDKIFMGYKES